MRYSHWYNPLCRRRTLGSVSTPGAGKRRYGNNENAEYKCEEAVVNYDVNRYDIERIVEDATWGVVFNDILVIHGSDLLSLLIIQIHCNFICLYPFWVVFKMNYRNILIHDYCNMCLIMIFFHVYFVL